jgi:hypothetical protein
MKPSALSNFLYKLWFTRDDDLDILQLLFAAIIVVTLAITWNVSMATGEDSAVKIEALVTLRWLAGLLVITAVPKWMLPFISSHTKNLDVGFKKSKSDDEIFDVHDETIR